MCWEMMNSMNRCLDEPLTEDTNWRNAKIILISFDKRVGKWPERPRASEVEHAKNKTFGKICGHRVEIEARCTK